MASQSPFYITPDRHDTTTTVYAFDSAAAVLAFASSDTAGWADDLTQDESAARPLYDNVLWVRAHREAVPGQAIRVRLERDVAAETAWHAGVNAVKL